jgi:hypothetical protein
MIVERINGGIMAGKQKQKQKQKRKRKHSRHYPPVVQLVLAVVATFVLWLNFLTMFHSQKINVGSGIILASHDPQVESITLESLVDLDPELIRRVSRNSTNTSALTLAEASLGKEPILRLLREAGIEILDTRVIQLLPTLQQVEQLYGKHGPRILGLAQCEQFLSSGGQAMGIAGMFDSGTNLAALYLDNNCIVPDHDILWQVPWGKHVVAEQRKDHHMAAPAAAMMKSSSSYGMSLEDHVIDHAAVMPIVMIRDPYFWMQSMCRQNYGAQWFHSSEHCPNLVPNHVDYKLYNFPKGTIPVRIKYDFGVRKWDSLAHLWSSWYQQYYKDADYPRLVVRFEDFIFYPKQVTQQICTCAGGTTRDDQNFKYQVESAKHGPGHGTARTSWVSAMVRYGSAERRDRLKGMTQEDVQLADDTFDLEMMQALSYQPSACC